MKAYITKIEEKEGSDDIIVAIRVPKYQTLGAYSPTGKLEEIDVLQSKEQRTLRLGAVKLEIIGEG